MFVKLCDNRSDALVAPSTSPRFVGVYYVLYIPDAFFLFMYAIALDTKICQHLLVLLLYL